MNLPTACDIAIIGAGPAGSAAACGLASSGLSILLIDKSSFPRWKVCGCCINADGLASLNRLGLHNLPGELHARPLTNLRLASGGRSATIPLSGSVSLSREALDTALVNHAISKGVHFLPETHAHLPNQEHFSAPGSSRENSGERLIHLHRGEEESTIHAKLVLVADGLGGHLLDDVPELGEAAEVASRIGAGAVIDAPTEHYKDGTIYMACGVGGYAGLVRLEDGRLDIAAALDPGFVKFHCGPALAVTALIQSAGLPTIENLQKYSWRGTPKLTRRRTRLGAERLLVLGDAAGYVEPFTGEGIAWALASGIAIAPLAAAAAAAAKSWSPDAVTQWESLHARLLGPRQRTCRRITGFLRRPTLTRAAVALLSIAPGLARPFTKSLGTPKLG